MKKNYYLSTWSREYPPSSCFYKQNLKIGLSYFQMSWRKQWGRKQRSPVRNTFGRKSVEKSLPESARTSLWKRLPLGRLGCPDIFWRKPSRLALCIVTRKWRRHSKRLGASEVEPQILAKYLRNQLADLEWAHANHFEMDVELHQGLLPRNLS